MEEAILALRPGTTISYKTSCTPQDSLLLPGLVFSLHHLTNSQARRVWAFLFLFLFFPCVSLVALPVVFVGEGASQEATLGNGSETSAAYVWIIGSGDDRPSEGGRGAVVDSQGDSLRAPHNDTGARRTRRGGDRFRTTEERRITTRTSLSFSSPIVVERSIDPFPSTVPAPSTAASRHKQAKLSHRPARTKTAHKNHLFAADINPPGDLHISFRRWSRKKRCPSLLEYRLGSLFFFATAACG